MKKLAIILGIFLLMFNLISAVEFVIKSEYDKGETLLAKVSGNFVDPILKDNIFFYRGHVKIPMNYDVARINEDYYIYAQLPENENNYSISIENVNYYQGTKIIDENIVKNFTITNNLADFLIEPGFIITNKDFEISVQNLQDFPVAISKGEATISGEPKGFFETLFGTPTQDNITSSEGVTLKSGEIKKINFGIENLESSTFKTVKLSTENLVYEIPVSVFVNKSKEEVKTKRITFDRGELDIIIPTNENKTRTIYLKNTGESALQNISLSISGILKQFTNLSVIQIDELKENSSLKIELFIFAGDEEKRLEGQITAKVFNESGSLYEYLPINLEFVKDFVPLNESEETQDTQTTSQTCEELNGKICDLDSECSSDSEYAKDGVCCLGECIEPTKSSTGKIIGWILIILILGLLVWFFKFKYKGAKKDINLLKIAKGKK